MSSDMDEIVQEFLVESYEALDRLDGDLLALERDPNSPDVLASIFRVMHTIKGTCGFLGFQKLERVAHAGESLLGGLRDGTLAVNPAITSALLSTGDVLRNLLGKVERSGNDGDQDFLHLVDTLERLRSSGGTDAPTHVPATPAAPRKRATAKGDVPKQAIPARPAPPGRDADPAEKASVAETNIRVDVQVLDNLMTLVGELVLTRNHIMQLTAGSTHDAPLLSAAAHLNGITSELQDGVMRTRLQPIHTAWARFPRVVRDLAMALGKQVRVRTEGDDTELDRSIIEAIKDPLMHLVRNAVDHGIEDPAEREAAGKPAEGAIVIRASHEGGQVTIEMQRRRPRDRPREGQGPRDRARPDRRGHRQDDSARATRSSSSSSPASRPPTRSRTCRAAASAWTSSRPTSRRIGGNVEVTTAPGKGTTYTLKIPLTLAIVPALLVTSGGERYAIPRSTWSSSCARRPSRSRTSTARRSTGCATACYRSCPWRPSSASIARPDRGRPARSSCSRPTTGASA